MQSPIAFVISLIILLLRCMSRQQKGLKRRPLHSQQIIGCFVSPDVIVSSNSSACHIVTQYITQYDFH